MECSFDGQPIERDSSENHGKNILDLNDDCMREILEYLDLCELVAVADVCCYFRRIAQIHFSTTKYNHLEIATVHKVSGMSGVSKILRNFGAFIVSIDVQHMSDCFFFNISNNDMEVERMSRIETKIMKLIRQYCDGSLQNLKWDFSNLSDGIVSMMQPLISQLKTLHLCARTNCKLFLKFLSKTEVLKVETLLLWAEKIDASIIDEFLAKCPHLKKIEIRCVNVDGDVFEPIATHVPLIENIKFTTNKSVDSTYLGNLSKLNALEICSCGSNFRQAIAAMADSQVPIDHLKLFSLDLFGYADHFVKSVSKFENIKSLTLYRINGWTLTHLIDSVKWLDELVELQLILTFTLSINSLLDLIENARALQNFYFAQWTEVIRIDRNAFMELVSIVKRRQENTHLRIVLWEESTELNVPVDLVRGCNDSVTLLLGRNYADLSSTIINVKSA